MKVKISELTGAALDRAVGWADACDLAAVEYSTRWEFGGPIIEREGISVWQFDDVTWKAEPPMVGVDCVYEAPTPLIAAMRCYVASKLGDEVEVPEEEWAATDGEHYRAFLATMPQFPSLQKGESK